MQAHLEPEAMLAFVRAAASPSAPTAGRAPVPATLRRLDRYPDVAVAWAYGVGWHATGAVVEPPTAGRGADGFEAGGDQAVRRWGDGLAPDGWRHPAPDAEVFVTGAYLVALGRLPDSGGLRAHADRVAVDGCGAVLASLVASPEARQRLRFPPAAVDPAVRLAEEVVAAVGLRGDAQAVAAVLAGVRDGRRVDWLVRAALRLRHGVRGSRLRRPLVPTLVRQVQLSAGLRAVLEDTGRQTELAWRTHTALEDRLDGLEGALHQLGSRGST